ncbi:MAG: PAS domain-containing sensor histidine kinase [Pseudomonadota bacterium]
MNLEFLRSFILVTGWPVLMAGSLFLLYKTYRFYQTVNKVVFGKLVLIMISGWLFTMYCLGVVATLAMYQNLETGVMIVLPIFIGWAITMAAIITITIKWSAEAATINKFYQNIEKQYKSIFEISPQAIVVMDKAGNILSTNDRIQDWSGYKTDTIVNNNIQSLPFITQESKNRIKNLLEDNHPNDSSASIIEFRNKNHETIYGEIVSTEMTDEDGNIIKNLSMISDITERIKLEKLRDDLTHMLVHDLKNPLFNISTTMELFLDDIFGELTQQQRDHLESVSSSAKQLFNLIMDILQIKNMEENSFSPQISTFPATELITNIKWLINYARKNEVSLDFSIESGMILSGDKKLIIRILENLITNAVKHTPKKGKVSLMINKDEGKYIFQIIDSGEGIGQKHLNQIFDKFYKVKDQSKNAQYDTGLGLAFCKMAIEAHAGHIFVESTEGLGTKFHFSLPIKES